MAAYKQLITYQKERGAGEYLRLAPVGCSDRSSDCISQELRRLVENAHDAPGQHRVESCDNRDADDGDDQAVLDKGLSSFAR
jgi:hypothetical protein